MSIYGYMMNEKQSKFEIRKAKNGEFYFVLIAPNGEIILQSEMYKSKSGCNACIESIIKNAPKAKIIDTTK